MSDIKVSYKGFNFKVVYEPGSTNPADFSSRHHISIEETPEEKREDAGVEDEEEDQVIVIGRLEELQ